MLPKNKRRGKRGSVKVNITLKSPNGELVGRQFNVDSDSEVTIRVPVPDGKEAQPGDKRSMLQRLADGIALVMPKPDLYDATS